MQATPLTKEIPFNYTSASDRQAVSLLLGEDIYKLLEELRGHRVTGRSARLLNRFFGELLIHRRNPYLFEEIVSSKNRRRRFFDNVRRDLDLVEQNYAGNARVLEVLSACRRALMDFRSDVESRPVLRNLLSRELGAIVGAGGIRFDPFTLTSHATDATDWRLYVPLAVAFPSKEPQVAPLLAAIARLGLKALPRGAGTGLTGGAVPLHPRCIVVNTERLDRIRGISSRAFEIDGASREAKVLSVEAGVVTERAMESAEGHGLVFATDPTSAWACTIGGNIAENAGGKDCVLYGTCIDNLLSFRLATSSGRTLTVRRVDHRLRKILPADPVTFELDDGSGELPRRISLLGSDIRKKGLWKDITNKALGGIPGLQKEGTDGVITSAEFVLHPEYEAKRTLCLEFFGESFDEASLVILRLARAFPFPDQGHEALSALEHFDDEYVRAIEYQVKARRAESPRAVLLVDLVGHDATDLDRGISKIRAVLADHPLTEMFLARDAAEGKRFWDDRKRLGAIARRTNAFKMNEDVVLPLEALAQFARFVEQTNVEEERHAQELFLERAAELFRSLTEGSGDPGQAADKVSTAQERCARAASAVRIASPTDLRALRPLDVIRAELSGIFRGHQAVLDRLEKVHREVRDRRIVLATHMHAGDGNVHVNVPVLSNDPAMLERADLVIDRVMAEVVKLGGVVSGEHGIGITKLKYLEPERLEALRRHREVLDPGGVMNPRKLEDRSVLDQVFTPSFNLLELEARILKYGQLEALAKSIAHCVRCGKCKPSCCVHHPARGMFFHPRNKNLAVGALIEALLYDAQRERSTRFELLRWLGEVGDHCTICHKCLAPCPVKIDTGEVSVLERELLVAWGKKRHARATRATLRYLESRSPTFNRAFRTAVVRLGGAAQRLGSALSQPLQPEEGGPGPYPLVLLRSPVPKVPKKTLREVLPPAEPDEALVLEPPKSGPDTRTVLYFPGCGSERLYSQVSMAALHLLGSVGVRVVLPPPFLCCGFPAHANARTEQYGRTVLRNTILLAQIREMFSHFAFDACVVTCGTCKEGLLAMEANQLFGGKVVDVAAYAADRGLRLGEAASEYLYHPPCHDSLAGGALSVLARTGGFGTPVAVPHCCSEAGTLALSRPDIADSMLHRKRAALAQARQKNTASVVLTNCPSCLQGLGRNEPLGLFAKHVVVAMAEKLTGEDWLSHFEAEAAKAQRVRF